MFFIIYVIFSFYLHNYNKYVIHYIIFQKSLQKLTKIAQHYIQKFYQLFVKFINVLPLENEKK